MSRCERCQGTGIVLYYAGARTKKTPCVWCSGSRTLEDLERELELRQAGRDIARERREIAEHNRRMAETEKTSQAPDASGGEREEP